MNLMPASHVEDAIARLEEQFPQYSSLLSFGAVAEGPGHALFQSLMEPTHSIVGKAPHAFKHMKKCTNIPSPLSHLTGDQSCKLYEFLDINGKYQDFLKFMSKSSSYADVHILLAMSMIWQLRITCLYADNLHELRFRHHKRLAQADLVIVACSSTDHFVSAGKRL